jgi:hypothetical protein
LIKLSGFLLTAAIVALGVSESGVLAAAGLTIMATVWTRVWGWGESFMAARDHADRPFFLNGEILSQRNREGPK